MELSRAVDIRERRLHTILTYNGDALDLNEQAKKASLKIGKFGFSQCGNCQEGCAKGQLYAIRDTALVAHSPIGCYASISESWLNGRSTAQVRGRGEFYNEAVCTNILEKDTIYGATEKLKQAIRETYERYHPKSIFVTTSCASGIVGDDVESVADIMTEELGIPVVEAACEGFKSRIWSTGFDVAFNSVLNTVVKPPEKKQDDLVNIFNFSGVDSFSPLLALLGLRVNYLIEQSTYEQIESISEAACSATICETLATFIGDKLEQLYGVPQVRAASPYGINWTDNWLREIARLTHKEDIVEEVIENEHKRIDEELAELREILKGKKVYIFSGDSYAHNMASVAIDLGLEVIGITTYHHDQIADTKEINSLDYLVNSVGNIPNYTICNKQPYQVIKILKQLNPDILIVRHLALSVDGYKLGIPTIYEGDSNKCVGYNGIIDLGHRIERVFKTQKLIKNIAEHVDFPYTDWWLDESTDPFYFVGETR